MPVRLPAVVMGMAMAPKATGAVLATRTVTAEVSRGSPSAISMAAVIATGAPNPARASRSPPKQNAMSMAWMRRSPRPTELKERRRSSKRLLATVSS